MLPPSCPCFCCERIQLWLAHSCTREVVDSLRLSGPVENKLTVWHKIGCLLLSVLVWSAWVWCQCHVCLELLLSHVQILPVPGNATVQFLMIDTVLLAGLSDPIDRSKPPVPPTDTRPADQQLEWIEETLASSKADWVFVCGHYPGMCL